MLLNSISFSLLVLSYLVVSLSFLLPLTLALLFIFDLKFSPLNFNRASLVDS